jgi:hypothetical protein
MHKQINYNSMASFTSEYLSSGEPGVSQTLATESWQNYSQKFAVVLDVAVICLKLIERDIVLSTSLS